MDRSTSRRRAASLLLLGALLQPLGAHAWVYPEHRDIALLAVETLDPERRAVFDQLWLEARSGHEKRLCRKGGDSGQGLAPACIDWAAMSAIAGDHSCSGKGLLESVLDTDWILNVADVAAQLKVDLARVAVMASPTQTDGAKGLAADVRRNVEDGAVRAERWNALRVADTRLQRADPEYVTRAGANNAHFLLARPSTGTTALQYGEEALSTGAEINALGVYGWYHMSALQKATRLANEKLEPAQRQALARAALVDEAFALHFLQDTFAAGHVAGTWGDASQRKGTHDYYNAAGLEVFMWKGSSESVVLMGDAHMRPQDAERAAASVRASLEQVLDHAVGRQGGTRLAHTPAAPAAPDAFDVCRNNRLIVREEGQRKTPEVSTLVVEVLAPTPVPTLGPGLGSMPRFRAEVGPFIGLAGSVDVSNISGGFVDGQSQNGWIGGVDLSLRVGFGLDGVIGESGDGLVFASLGLRGASASSNKFTSGGTLIQQAGSLTAAIPNRIGISTRLRMPFYLVPGDLLWLSPMYLLAPQTYSDMAVTAANGGLIPWQQGLSTRYGRFQFVLGRELGATFYGSLSTDTLLAPSSVPAYNPTVLNFKSVSYDLPILEYRPYRAFDTRQSSALVFQLFGGIDVPYGESVVAPPGAPTPGLKNVYSLGVRLIFDWRRYF